MKLKNFLSICFYQDDLIRLWYRTHSGRFIPVDTVYQPIKASEAATKMPICNAIVFCVIDNSSVDEQYKDAINIALENPDYHASEEGAVVMHPADFDYPKLPAPKKERKFRLFTSWNNSGWKPAKVRTCGSVIGYDSKRRQIQEIESTCYYWLWFRLEVTHDFKFCVYNH